MSAPPARRSWITDLPWVLALLAVSTWQIVRSMGWSPTVWVDTLFENVFIKDCLDDGQCSTVGAGATAGIFHSAGYLHWRVFLEWAGIGPDGTHGILLVLTALGVVLAAIAARRIDGGVAAGLTAVLVVLSIGIPTQLNVISDVAPLPFLGCAFLLVALAASEKQTLPLTAVLSVLGGVIANVYATGLLCVVTSVLLAMKTNRRRAHVAAALLSFGVTTFVIAPGTWITDARLILSHGVVGNAEGSGHRALFSIPLARLTAAATGVWILAALIRPSFRRRIDVPAAVLVPLFIPLALGSWVGKLDPQDKYCSHVIAAVAATLAVTAASLGRLLWSRVPRLGGLVEGAAPYLGVGVIALAGARQSAPQNAETLSYVTYRDLEAAQQVLTHKHHWTSGIARQNLRAVDEVVKRAVLEWPAAWEPSTNDSDGHRAFMVRAPRERLPSTPANAELVSSDPAASTLMIFSCSWIDWRAFRSCVRNVGQADEQCSDSGLPTEQDIHQDYGAPGMPSPNDIRVGSKHLTLHLPLRPRADCPNFAVRVPRLAGVCPGRIVGVSGMTPEIDPNGRSALLKLADVAPESTPELVMEWELGGPLCSTQYRGVPPFFVEGDPASADFIAGLLPVWSDG